MSVLTESPNPQTQRDSGLIHIVDTDRCPIPPWVALCGFSDPNRLPPSFERGVPSCVVCLAEFERFTGYSWTDFYGVR